MVAITALPWVGIGSLASGLALGGVAAYLGRHRDKPGGRWFIASLSMQSLWCLTYGIALFVAAPTIRLWLEVASWIGLSWVGYLFLGFALDYTGYSDLRQSWLFLSLGSVPLGGTVLLLTTPLHSLMWSGERTVRVLNIVAVEYNFQIGGYLVLIVGMAYAGVGVLLLAETVLSYGPAYRREAVAVGFSTVPPTAGLLVWMLGAGPVAAVNWGVVLSLPHALLDAYAFVGTNMFETSPTTRRVADQEAIDAVPDPVLILDGDARIVDCNDAAREAFDGLSEGARTLSVGDILPGDPTNAEAATDDYMSVMTAEGRRQFRVRSTPLVDPRDAIVGYSLVFQDVTAEREREQRLEVLNRVLRHNLLNKLNVIQMSAAQLRARLDAPSEREIADRIVTNGEALVATSEKARAFDDLRGRSPDFQRVDVAGIVADAVSETGGPDGSASVRTTPEMETDLVTDPEVLRLALRNALKNALEHTEGDASSIDVVVKDANRQGYAMCIEISDDGPGIPAHEIEVVKQGLETDLDHGSGIGLWILEWSLERLGGAVEYDQAESGTTVRLFLPADPTTPSGDRAGS